MSIFGSMSTAVLGLNAQSRALGHISDNIANAQTLGYKRVNSSFETLVLQSNERLHSPGGVVARPVFLNNIQGAVSQVQSQTNAAIQGQGFFSVSKLSRGLTGPGQSGETVQTQTGTLNADNVYYTRVGDFELDKNRYLVNSAGFALNGWVVDDATGQLKKDVVQPIQVNTLTDRPQATQNITLGANLPATPADGVPIPSSSIQIFDTQGNARTVQFNWRQDGVNNWRLGIEAPGSSTQPVEGTFAGGTAAMAAGPVVPGVTPVAQVSNVLVNGSSTTLPSTVTIGGRTNYYPDDTSQDNIRVGDTYSVTIQGTNTAPTTYSIGPFDTAGGANDISNFTSFSDVAAALASVINTATPAPYIAEIDANDPRKLSIKTIDGTPVDVDGTFVNAASPQLSTVSGPATNLTGTVGGNQQSVFTFSTATIDVGDEFRVTIEGREFSTRVTAANVATLGNINGVVADLVTQINAAVPALNITATTGATATGGAAGGTANQLVLDGSAAMTTFTSSTAITNADTRKNTVNASTSADWTALTATTTQAASATTVEITQLDFPSQDLKVPDQYVVNVLGTEFKTTISYSNINSLEDMDGVIDDLVTQINDAGLAVTASRSASGTLLLTGTILNTPLSVSGAAVDVTATNNVRIGDTYTVTIDSVPYEVEVTEDNVFTMGSYEGIANALASAINSARPPAPVIASVVNSELKLTARNAGTPFKVEQDYTSGAASANKVTGPTVSDPTESRGQRQEFSFPQTQIDIGDRYTVSIDGVPVSVSVDQTNYGNFENISGVIQELANRINAAGLNVVASATGGRLSIVHNTPDTGMFEAEASINNATGSSGTLTLSTATSNIPGVRQQQSVTLTGSPGDIDAEYSVSINGTPITYRTTGEETTMEDITAQLANMINQSTSLPVTASAQGGVLTVIAKNEDGDTADQFTLDTFALSGETPAHVLLSFGTDADNVGTITDISTSKVGTGTAVTSVNKAVGEDATITFTVDYGFGPQQVTLNVGQFGKSGGVTQYAGTEINVTQLVQDGASRGQFKEVVYGDNGDVIVNYDNGRSRTIGRIPVVTFNDPNSLQREAGGVFIETEDGGRPNFNDPGNNGAGSVIANSVESSNVDIADEFTKLIVTQRTYSANTKIVTTSDEMLQEVLGLKR